MNSGVLYWNKRRLHNFWWNNFRKHGGGGGNLYYRIPYKLNEDNILSKWDLENIREIVETLFKKNPDFKNCDICMGLINNQVFTSEKWITAIVFTKDRKFYDKYTAEHQAIRAML